MKIEAIKIKKDENDVYAQSGCIYATFFLDDKEFGISIKYKEKEIDNFHEEDAEDKHIEILKKELSKLVNQIKEDYNNDEESKQMILKKFKKQIL
jgi:hypothetical protein